MYYVFNQSFYKYLWLVFVPLIKFHCLNKLSRFVKKWYGVWKNECEIRWMVWCINRAKKWKTKRKKNSLRANQITVVNKKNIKWWALSQQQRVRKKHPIIGKPNGNNGEKRQNKKNLQSGSFWYRILKGGKQLHFFCIRVKKNRILH